MNFRYAFRVEYVGTDFSGSQLQPDKRTIQGELEKAIEILTRQKIRIRMSGRTDCGVHSKGQMSHFEIDNKINIKRFVHSMNAILPSDMNICDMKEVEKTFHVQKSAKYKHYRYVIYNSQERSVFAKYALHIREKLDVQKMNEAIKFLKGIHDFSGFKKAQTTNPAVVCNIFEAEVSSFESYIYIDIIGDRFLYNMVRIIVGTLLDVGVGKRPVDCFLEILETKDRRKAAQTAPSDGLMLMKVGYDNNYEL